MTSTMKVNDKEADVVYIQLNDELVSESDESREGTILDYDAHGRIVGIEVPEASEKMTTPDRVEMA